MKVSTRLERAKAGWTRPANSIQASGHVNGRINRPDTRQHLTRRQPPSKTSCIHGGVHTRTLLAAALRQDRPPRRVSLPIGA